jgi:hypothetical protein
MIQIRQFSGWYQAINVSFLCVASDGIENVQVEDSDLRDQSTAE